MALYIGNQKVAPTVMPSSGGVSIPLEVSANGELQKPTTPFTWSLPSNVTEIKNMALAWAFRNSSLSSIDFNNLTTISGTYTCYLSFASCQYLITLDFNNLTTINGDYALAAMCNDCSNLTNINLSNLTTLKGSNAMQRAFSLCNKLKILSFNSLKSTSFGSYTNQFNDMLSGVTGCTVHFPSNLQSVIGNWSDVTSGFGGTNTTVLFDLPATT